MTTKRKTITLVAVLLITILLASTLSSCMFFNRGEEGFELLLDELAAAMLQGDFISANILLSDASALGINIETAELYRPAVNEAEYKSGFEALSELATTIMTYRYKKLNAQQQIAYNVLLEYFSNRAKRADYYYFQDDYLSGYLGTNANLPIYLDRISFRTVADVEKYIQLVTDVPVAFDAYVFYERDRCANGYGRADFVYANIIEQAKNMAPEGKDSENFLIENFNTKLQNSGLTLTTEQINSFESQNSTAITTKMLPAYRKLATDVEQLMVDYPTASRNQQGLSHFNNGQAYYELVFQDSTSCSDTVNQALEKLISKRGEYLLELGRLQNRIVDAGGDASALITQIESENDYSPANLQAIITELQLDIAADFPAVSLGNHSVKFSYVDPTMKDNYSPAAYVSSPIDLASSDETIIVNPPDDPTDGYVVFELLSHEGFAGHLYENLYTKNSGTHMVRSLLGFGGWSEGWAEYTQMYSVKYYDTVGSLKSMAYELILLNRLLSGIESSIIDILVNYNGYSRAQLIDWLSENSMFVSASSATLEQRTDYADYYFERSIEVPANSAKYYYSYLKFIELRDAYKAKLGGAYTDMVFHTAVMQNGAMSFDLLGKRI